MMSEDDMQIERSDLLPSTFVFGVMALANALVPVLAWYLWVDKYNHAMNQWTKNSWWTLWIGNIVVYGFNAFFWPFSYLGGKTASFYGWLWKATETLGPALFLTVVTMFLVAGIYMPSDKTVWQSLVVYFVVSMIFGQMSMHFGEAAQMYYLWGEWDKMHADAKDWCAQDGDGNCIMCEEGDQDCK